MEYLFNILEYETYNDEQEILIRNGQKMESYQIDSEEELNRLLNRIKNEQEK